MITDKNYFQNMTDNQLQEELIAAFFLNDIKLANHLLNSPELKKNASLYIEKDCDTVPFLHVCSSNNLEMVEYLTSQLNFNREDIEKAVTLNGQTPLMISLYYGQFDIVNYLLNEPKFEKYNDLAWIDDRGRNIFIMACMSSLELPQPKGRGFLLHWK